ncbi:MAG: hypothetical protein C4589_03000 [Peptococcaceae bacterium]|nr:MAG: hypothetical protein C4589_03000 [Peptococcaceae bacterium]
MKAVEFLTVEERQKLLAGTGTQEQEQRKTSMPALLAEMEALDIAGRPEFFNKKVLPEFAYINPVNRDVAITAVAKLLKPCGVTLQAIRQMVKLSMPEDAGAEDAGGDGRKSQADVLIELAEAATLFHDDLGEPFAVVDVGGHGEVWPVKSKFFRRWLVGRFYATTGKAPNSDAISQAMGVVEAKACFDGPEHKLHLRVAEHGGAFWYDLADDQWRAVRITPDGWEVVDRPPVLFRRYKNTAPQVEPRRAKGGLPRLLDFVNLGSEENRVLLLVYAVTCLVPGIPHVIPPFHGEKGAAKSTSLRVLRRAVDPAHRELLTMPKEQNELALMLAHNYMPAFDNLDGLQSWQSDMLCCASTGGGISKRELYTDEDEVILSFLRCPTLNGINLVVSRPDLLDRSLLFGLDRINQADRRGEAEFWQAFEEARPGIVAGMFDALAGAMKIYPALKLSGLPRMADFCRWGTAVAEALGIGGQVFLDAYLRNIGKANEEAISANPVAAAVTSLMAERSLWRGTAAELLGELEKVAVDEKISTRARSWPQAANALTRRLRQIKSNLLDAGIAYSIARDSSNKSFIVIRKDSEKTSGISGISETQAGQGFQARRYSGDISGDVKTSGKPPGPEVYGGKYSGGTGDTGDIFPTLSEDEKNNFNAKSAGGDLNGVDDVPF